MATKDYPEPSAHINMYVGGFRRTGLGHQLKSEARHIMSARDHISDAYHDLTNAGNTTDVLDLRSELHRIIVHLDSLAHSAEEQYNQNI